MPKNEYICDCNIVHAEHVDAALKNLPPDGLISDVAGFYKIIGDGTRCKLLFALSAGEMCVCDLANVLSMSKSSISHQLSKLRSCGVVKCRREGKEVYYSLDDAHVSEIFKVSLEHINHRHGEKNI
ncbi:MAG: ArsR/SmtB family transcription factor [Eubacteriales bacterium]